MGFLNNTDQLPAEERQREIRDQVVSKVLGLRSRSGGEIDS